MRGFASSEYANVHRGVHFLSAAATGHYEGARETARRFLNAAHGEEIVFTKGGTEAINLVAYSFAAPRIAAGDEIVLTVMEHHSNIVPWHFLRERQGAVLRWIDELRGLREYFIEYNHLPDFHSGLMCVAALYRHTL